MGFLWNRKKNPSEHQATEGILGFALLKDTAFSVEAFFSWMKEDWGFTPSYTFEGEVLEFKLSGFQFVLRHMPIPLSKEETAAACNFSLEENIRETVSSHRSYVIVSIFGASKAEKINSRIGFTKVCMSLMGMENACGIFLGAFQLMLSSDTYRRPKSVMDAAESHGDRYLPPNLWIRFGFTRSGNGVIGYTQGFAQLGKRELEICKADMELPVLYQILFQLSFQMVGRDADLNHGLIDLQGTEGCLTIITKIWKSNLSENEVTHLIL